jgi:hypothetical protein
VAKQVDCEIKIASNQDEGKWDVIVSDGVTPVTVSAQILVVA